MSKKIFILSILLLSITAFSQEDAWVYFNSKPDAAAFFSSPLTELSQRSIDRRVAQNILIDFKDAPIHQDFIDQVSSSAGITLLAKSKWLNCVHVRGGVADINALLSLTFVDYIHFADNSLNLRNAVTNNSRLRRHHRSQSLISFNYGNSYNQIHMLNGDLLHAQDFTGSGKVIAVLDAGFPGVNLLAPFQRLRDNNLILGGYDYVHKSTDFYTSDDHGTMVLSTMGGFVDNALVGTAPDAGYYLFITEDVDSENPVEESNWVEAAEQADRVGADVITSSLGYFAFDNINYGHTYEDMTGNAAFASQGANIAFSRGIVVVASAGNEGGNDEPHVGVPAEANNVLAIGSVRANRIRSGFSSVGPTFDGRIKPDLMAQGSAAVLANTNGDVVTANGTSFSGPIMAGMIATFWSAVPQLTNQEVVTLVRQSADRFNTPDNEYGFGIPDFSLALNNALLNNNFYNKNKFSIYPNPAKESISLSSSNGFENATIAVYNTLGQLVLKQSVSGQNSKVTLSSMNAGMYLYTIQNGTYFQTGKITKQ